MSRVSAPQVSPLREGGAGALLSQSSSVALGGSVALRAGEWEDVKEAPLPPSAEALLEVAGLQVYKVRPGDHHHHHHHHHHDHHLIQHH
jgi:hypothetical protein